MQPLERNNKLEQRNRINLHQLANDALLKRTLEEALGENPQVRPDRPANASPLNPVTEARYSRSEVCLKTD